MANYTQIMLPGDSLNPTDRLWAENQGFYLILQEDGNLVLYSNETADPTAMWATQTQGHNPMFFGLDNFGNAVLYGVGSVKLWQTATYLPTYLGTSLVLQNDGNLILYGHSALFSAFGGNPFPAPARVIPGPIPAPANGPSGFNLTSVVRTVGAAEQVIQGAITIAGALLP